VKAELTFLLPFETPKLLIVKKETKQYWSAIDLADNMHNFLNISKNLNSKNIFRLLREKSYATFLPV